MLKENEKTTGKTAKLILDGQTYELPIIVGTENEHAIDISSLRNDTGHITYDPGFGNTGACSSNITFVDGENGILRYRGYPIEQLAEHGTFIETAYLLIFGELPTRSQREKFRDYLSEQELLHEDLRHHFEGFPSNGHPMAILSAVINALGCYHPDLLEITSKGEFLRAAAKIISKVRTIAAWSYRKAHGLPFIYPDPNLSYCRNFLHMMHSIPYQQFEPTDAQVRALTLFFLLHADHEQNCSCSTVRMVQSTEANMFASVSAGICALWGRLHGGANAGVVSMLEEIHEGGTSIPQYIEKVKRKECRLMGFGHRIYKSFDPRARILRKAAHDMLESTGNDDPLLDIALELAEVAMNDEYFTERKLYPNVDFYSGIILRALGIPVNMFPVMFAIGRMPGWIAHWNEANTDGIVRIHRPRQIYTGNEERSYIPIDTRL
ncbi:citrate synthase [uncultured Pseudodesulfovibrio sp.]|uniref:citrate synthase n=1 Tax=uncultured Pseudodesulfovibrio sp. TaxID=2035858 RepID=UPI0029C699DF|nr:citrate synthase [uncultured Pseudodesulfovibrio sp.]